MSARPRIGEMLINAGLLTQEQLARALSQQREQGAAARPLGRLLVELGYVSEAQLTRLLSQHLSVPWVSLSHIEFSKQLLSLVPREVAEEFGVIPVYVRRERGAGDTLYLAMEDPTNDDAVRRISAAAGMPVKAMIASPSDVRNALRAAYDPNHRPASIPPRARPSVAPGRLPPAPAAAPTPARAPEAPAASADAPAVAPAQPSVEIPAAPRAPGIALTLLDGTTLRIPAQRRREPDAAEAAAAGEAATGARGPAERMSTAEVLAALRAIADGARPEDVLGGGRSESVLATLITVMLRKQLITEAEFAEEWQKG